MLLTDSDGLRWFPKEPVAYAVGGAREALASLGRQAGDELAELLSQVLHIALGADRGFSGCLGGLVQATVPRVREEEDGHVFPDGPYEPQQNHARPRAVAGEPGVPGTRRGHHHVEDDDVRPLRAFGFEDTYERHCARELPDLPFLWKKLPVPPLDSFGLVVACNNTNPAHCRPHAANGQPVVASIV